ncbi:hypothetical protein GGR56DRAFT_310306 [Xylariaceae sp. FL0804]|nr:hypothetical protein GGR56DRAFT_310306 [Xylariaceae sp. FL0804]
MNYSSPPFLTLSFDGNSLNSGDSAVRREEEAGKTARRRPSSHLISYPQYGSGADDMAPAPSATHDISRVSYHVKRLPLFAEALEDSVARAFPNRSHSLRYQKVHAILLHWKSDDLFVLPELEDLGACFREDYGYETETFAIPSDNSHLELMLRIGAMIKEHESNGTLFVIYYGGHAKIDESRQSTWCATRSPESPWLQWSAIQTLLERSLSDVLILLDCCAGAASATFPSGNSITETISASSWDAIAPDPGRYSFTNALIEVLQVWKRRTFSAAMLHAEVLARLKHPRPVLINGKHFEARSTPVHFMMTANHKIPSIEMSRVVPTEARPPSPSNSSFDLSPSFGRSVGPQDIVGSEPNEDVPHVMVSLALESDQRLNINDWETWLASIPALAKYVKVQGVFKSHSTLLLLSLPVMVWDLLPENPACNFVAFIRSNNLVGQGHQIEPPAAQEEIPEWADEDADLRSMYSGTTAYTPSSRARHSIRSVLSAPLEFQDDDTRSIRSSRGPWPLRQPPVSHGGLGRTSSSDTSARKLTGNSSPARSRLSPETQERLERYFQGNPKPTLAALESLASTIGTNTVDIDIWFHRRREQQQLSTGSQDSKTEEYGHDSPRSDAKMILPGHLNELLEIFPAGGIVVIDLRSPAEYAKSHIHGAINLRAPASVISGASMELIEQALPDEASKSSFNRWYTSKCVVFYDKVVEFTWQAPTAEALFRKFKSKGWLGQCFVLKGHYLEFAISFDKYIVGAKTSDSAKRYLAGLQEVSWETDKEVHQRYDDWYNVLEAEDRVYSTYLTQERKAERMRKTEEQQRAVEDEFKRTHPDLYRQAAAVDRRRGGGGGGGPPTVLVPHPNFERGIAKMQEAATAQRADPGGGGGKSGAARGRTGGQQSSSYRGYHHSSSETADYNNSRIIPEHEEVQYEPGFQKVAADPGSSGGGARATPAETAAGQQDRRPKPPAGAGAGGGRNIFNKMMRGSRPD